MDQSYTNHQKLHWLFENKKININYSSLFDLKPDPLPEDFDFDRAEGMMLGLAIGDALGITTEGMLPQERLSFCGEICDYLPNRYAILKPGEETRGYPSDDTQLAFWTLEQMIEDGGLKPDNLAAKFCRRRIFGIGSTVFKFIRNYKTGRIPWYECGPQSAGNGALMRIAPMVIPHLKEPTPDLWTDTALSAMITHNDSASIAACVSVIYMIWQLFRMEGAPDPQWWIEEYVKVAKELEKVDTYRTRGGAFREYQGFLWRFVQEKVSKAYAENLSVVEACAAWYSGAYLLETVPSILYIMMKHGDNLKDAIVRAVNDTVDNDTIAAVVGALAGALHSKKCIPPRWISGLSGRTTHRDDGKVFELLKEAKRIWWHS